MFFYKQKIYYISKVAFLMSKGLILAIGDEWYRL